MPQHKSVLFAVLFLLTLLLAVAVVPAAWAAPSDNTAPTTAGAGAAAAADASHARVVTLSLVQGVVIARRPGSEKWERATANTPIEEGASIATARHSLVEVQFENGSTVRLGELSRLDFNKMAVAAHSGTINQLKLALGTATVNVDPGRHDEYLLDASGASLTPHGKSEFRTDLRPGHLRVEVFRGHVEVMDPKQSAKLGKDRGLAYDYRAQSAFQVTDMIHPDDWDKWVEARDRQAALAAENDDLVTTPGDQLYRWEDGIVPFGGMGNLPIPTDAGN